MSNRDAKANRFPSRATTARGLVLASCSLLVYLSPVSGQGVSGRVVEDETRVGVPAAEVVLVDSAGVVRGRATADASGGFTVSARSGGEYRLRVERLGYEPYASPRFELGRDETLYVEVRLGVGAVPLEPMLVTALTRPAGGRTAEFHQRRDDPAYAGGAFLTRSDIEASVSPRTTDLLVRVPGVVLTGVSESGPGTTRYGIQLRGSGGGNLTGVCSPAIYVDGVRARQTDYSSVDDFLDPSMLEGVEVYSRAAFAPPQYAAANDCGVVLFWTRPAEQGRDWSWKRLAAGGAGIVLFTIIAVR